MLSVRPQEALMQVYHQGYAEQIDVADPTIVARCCDHG
jgi:hypothetical protein